MIYKLRENLTGFSVHHITKKNYKKAFPVYTSNTPFFMLVEEKIPTEKDVLDTLTNFPEDYTKGKKLFLTVSTECELKAPPLAVVDILLDYPVTSHIWISMLIVDEAKKNSGIGKKIVTSIFSSAKSLGYIKAGAAVSGRNTAAVNFWEGTGFIKQREIVHNHNGIVQPIIVMERDL